MTSASAPGRVNLIGEHTDYNGGYVLPVSLPFRVSVELTPREDRLVRASSANIDDGRWHERDLGDERRTGTWVDHVAGAAGVLVRLGSIDRGFDVRIGSDIPMGAGLGSSGALEVAVVRALRDTFRLDVDDVTIAKLAQRSENEVVGARSGIMDQMAASVGREGEALFLDCRTLVTRRIPLCAELELAVVHSGVAHRHSAGSYNDRRRECEDAARALGIAELRDAGIADLDRIALLPEPLSRRARHVVTEDARVLEAVEALRTCDLPRLGALLDASHRSLRDDFEVSTPEVDLLVELLREQQGIHGARITGGGFGGSVVAVADAGAGHHAAAIAVDGFRERTDLDARVLFPALAL